MSEDELKKDFTKGWGKKCAEYHPECPACIAWKWFEGSGITYLQELTQRIALESRIDEAKFMKLAITVGETSVDEMDGYCDNRLEQLKSQLQNLDNSNKDKETK
jgi:hypothetical protein